jgi:hypothetical protein
MTKTIVKLIDHLVDEIASEYNLNPKDVKDVENLLYSALELASERSNRSNNQDNNQEQLLSSSPSLKKENSRVKEDKKDVFTIFKNIKLELSKGFKILFDKD